jgi:ATP-dependent Clp protease adapter protein ClpS
MSFRDDLIKDYLEQQQKNAAQPPQYALILHMNPDAYDLDLHLDVQHVLEDHMGIDTTEVAKAIKGAANSGHAVIKAVTKDIGESLMLRIRTCTVMFLSRDFKVALEPM